MRYFLVGFLLVGLLVVSVAGLRGGKSRKPPIEVFPDMARQLKLRPQNVDGFFSDSRSSRLLVPGTIARSTAYRLSSSDSNKVVFPFEDAPVTIQAEVGVSGFPGAAIRWSHRGLCRSFHARACSRPPEPTSKIR